MTARFTLGRICDSCPTPVSDKSKGRCRLCHIRAMNVDPEMRKRRGAAISQRCKDDPEFHAMKLRVVRRNVSKANCDPARQKWLRDHGHATIHCLQTPEVTAKRIAAIRASNRRRKLTWLPDEFRAEYRRMVKNQKVRATDARQIIEAKMADIQAARSGQLDSAIFWLNRIAPTAKLPDGTYRYGNGILRAGEVIERAKLKGWEPVGMAA